MLKFVIIVVAVVVLVWMLLGRNRRVPPPGRPGGAGAAPQAMLACAHCGVHLPAADAQTDAGGRAYCSEAHRLAGPRDGA